MSKRQYNSRNGPNFGYHKSRDHLRELLKSVSFYLMLTLVFILPFRGWITVSRGVTIAVPLGAIVGSVWIFSVVLNPRIRHPDTFHLVLGILVLWMGMTSLWAINPSHSVIETVRFGLYLLIGLAIWDLFQTRRAIELALLAYVLGALLTMSIELYYYFILGLERLTTLSNPNYLSGRLLFALPFAWYFGFKRSIRFFHSFRIVSIAYIGLLIPTIVWTQSRQGLIAMIIGIVILVAFTDRLRKYLIALPAIAIGMLAYARSVHGERFEEIPTILNEILTVLRGESITSPTTPRVVIIDGTLDLFYAKPLTGYGIGNFNGAFEAMHGVSRSAHNSYLGMAVETGIVGVLIFLSLFVLLIRQVGVHPEKGLIIGFIGIWAVLSLTNDWHTGFAVWGCLFLLLSFTRMAPTIS